MAKRLPLRRDSVRRFVNEVVIAKKVELLDATG